MDSRLKQYTITLEVMAHSDEEVKERFKKVILDDRTVSFDITSDEETTCSHPLG